MSEEQSGFICLSGTLCDQRPLRCQNALSLSDFRCAFRPAHNTARPMPVQRPLIAIRTQDLFAWAYQRSRSRWIPPMRNVYRARTHRRPAQAPLMTFCSGRRCAQPSRGPPTSQMHPPGRSKARHIPRGTPWGNTSPVPGPTGAPRRRVSLDLKKAGKSDPTQTAPLLMRFT